MKKQLPGWAVLLIITLAAGLALGGTYALTQEPIAQQAVLAADNARKAALPNADSFEELTLNEGASVDWAYAGLKEGNTVGYVAQKTVNGFGGKVEVIAGVDTTGAPDTFTIGGISVGGSSFSETAGLGARSKEPAFTDQFAGKVYPVSYIKAGGTATESTVDALTSATITTTAVVNGVNDIVKYVKADVLGIAGVEMPAKPADGVFSASEKGFRGPVYVEAAFDAAGKVTYIKVGDESFAEDIGVGVIEPDFMIQFIGKQMPLEVSDIDVIAGATISSTAVVKALNNAYAIAGGAEIVVPETPTMPEKPAEGVFSAAEKGFAGPVYVEAAFDADGKITYLGVGDDQFAETDGFGARALEAEEQYPFIGKQMPLEIGDVDALTGATFTKTAIVNGLNKAYAASKGEVIEEPIVEEIVMPEKPADGVFSAAEKGFAGPVYVEAAFDADGKITYISVGDDQFAETDGFGAKALLPENQYPFIGKQMPLEISDVDALTGATFTKTAIVNGLNKAYSASKGEAEPAATEAPADTKAIAEGAFTASAQGFGGPVTVTAAFDADGKITSISISNNSFNETAGLGARALEDSFQVQFLGKQMPLTLADIDAIAGATITSTAVVDALNAAYEKSQSSAEAEPAATEAPDETKAIAEGTFTASAQGFGGPVAVAAAFDAGGKITSISIGDNSFNETAGLGALALEESFQLQFLGKQMPLTLADIDAIAGATITSTAVVDALNAAYEKAQISIEAEPAPTAEPEIIGGADEPTAIILPAAVNSDGLNTSEVICFFTAVKVEAQFADGKVAALNVSDKQIGNDQDYAPSSQQEAMEALFVGAALPLDTNQATPYASAVAIALNQAFGQPGQSSSAVILPAAVDSDGWYTSEVICFFTAVKVEAQFADGKVAALNVADKQIGSDQDFAPSTQQEAMQALFVGAALPVDNNQATPYASAVAVALNQAFGASGQGLAAESSEPGAGGIGGSVMFFSQYIALAAFDGNKLVNYAVYTVPVDAEKTEDKALVNDPALDSALIGQDMPLNPADFTGSIGGVPAYAVNAIVIALNDAYYTQFSARQQ